MSTSKKSYLYILFTNEKQKMYIMVKSSLDNDETKRFHDTI